MLRLLWLSALVVAADQISKFWVMARFEDYEVLTIWPVFNLTLVYNTGAAFSFLSDAGGWQRWFFITVGIVVSVVMAVWLGRLRREERLTAYGLALVIGGPMTVLFGLFLGEGVGMGALGLLMGLGGGIGLAALLVAVAKPFVRIASAATSSSVFFQGPEEAS